MKFSPTPSANRVGRNENVSKIAAGLGGALRGKAGQGKAGPGGALQGKAKQGEATSIIQRVDCWMHWRKLQPGRSGTGMALLGRAGRGLARMGKD